MRGVLWGAAAAAYAGGVVAIALAGVRETRVPGSGFPVLGEILKQLLTREICFFLRCVGRLDAL